jgi:hypothetical protein
MTFDEHYLCHKAVERLEAKFKKMQADLKHGEKITVRHIDAALDLITNKEWLRLKNHLDEDFCRQSKFGISRYFGFHGKRCEKDFWVKIRKGWTGGFGANVKFFGKRWHWIARHFKAIDDSPPISTRETHI